MTLAELRAWLDAHGFSSTALNSDMSSAQDVALNSAYRRIVGTRRWSWLEATATLTTTTDQANVSVASVTDLGAIDAVRSEKGTEYQDLVYMEPYELRDRAFTDRDSGKPQYWTFYDGEIRLFPTPDGVYTLTVEYIVNPDDLADADSPLFHDSFHDIVGWGALMDIGVRERDWNLYNAAEAQYLRRLKEMENFYGVRQRQSATHVRRSSFWDNVGWRA